MARSGDATWRERADTGVMSTVTANNLEIMKQAYTAFGDGAIEAVVGLMDPDIEWNEAEHSLWHQPGGHHGPGEVLSNVFARIGDDFDVFEVVPETFHDAGEKIVVEGRYRATAKATGEPLDAQVCHVWTIRNGRIVAFQQYVDTWQLARVSGRTPV